MMMEAVQVTMMRVRYVIFTTKTVVVYPTTQ
jgi:hypothetical protein